VADPVRTNRSRRAFLVRSGALVVGAATGTLASVTTLAQRATAPSKVVAVSIEGMQYSPAVVSVERGQTVEWINKDLFPHTVTADGAFDSGDIAADAKWSFVPRTAGEFAYRCKLHPTMKARLIVRDA
jgi:plastocyanin